MLRIYRLLAGTFDGQAAAEPRDRPSTIGWGIDMQGLPCPLGPSIILASSRRIAKSVSACAPTRLVTAFRCMCSYVLVNTFFMGQLMRALTAEDCIQSPTFAMASSERSEISQSPCKGPSFTVSHGEYRYSPREKRGRRWALPTFHLLPAHSQFVICLPSPFRQVGISLYRTGGQVEPCQ